jgi:methyl-accepting chemotaxis protein
MGAAIRDNTPRAVVTALIVGPLLTLINQYDAIAGEDVFSWLQAGLTFLVPFAVSLVTSLLIARKNGGPH